MGRCRRRNFGFAFAVIVQPTVRNDGMWRQRSSPLIHSETLVAQAAARLFTSRLNTSVQLAAKLASLVLALYPERLSYFLCTDGTIKEWDRIQSFLLDVLHGAVSVLFAR